ncbi:MAG: hypothetical protein U0941_21915 [Planctomycetaceae bacterium]
MIAQFALMLMLGMSLMWALMPRAQVTAGFFRIQMMIALGLGVLAILTLGSLTPAVETSSVDRWIFAARVAVGVAALAGYVGSVFWMLDRRPGGTVCVFVIMLSTFASLLFSRGDLASITTPAGQLLLISQLATAAVLGGAVTSMLLGHWYLTAPTMSIEPLKRLSLLFGIAVGIRLVVSIIGWATGGHGLVDGTHWTWFALRWLAGIAGPLVIAVMALRILRYRNTQAATGVLFAGVILTFIGEMSAALLYSELKVPF